MAEAGLYKILTSHYPDLQYVVIRLHCPFPTSDTEIPGGEEGAVTLEAIPMKARRVLALGSVHMIQLHGAHVQKRRLLRPDTPSPPNDSGSWTGSTGVGGIAETCGHPVDVGSAVPGYTLMGSSLSLESFCL